MIVVIDHDINTDGSVCGVHTIDSANPVFQTTFTAINGNPALQAAAGWSRVHNVTGRPLGETRWQLLAAMALTASVGDFLHAKSIT